MIEKLEIDEKGFCQFCQQIKTVAYICCHSGNVVGICPKCMIEQAMKINNKKKPRFSTGPGFN